MLSSANLAGDSAKRSTVPVVGEAPAEFSNAAQRRILELEAQVKQLEEEANLATEVQLQSEEIARAQIEQLEKALGLVKMHNGDLDRHLKLSEQKIKMLEDELKRRNRVEKALNKKINQLIEQGTRENQERDKLAQQMRTLTAKLDDRIQEEAFGLKVATSIEQNKPQNYNNEQQGPATPVRSLGIIEDFSLSDRIGATREGKELQSSRNSSHLMTVDDFVGLSTKVSRTVQQRNLSEDLSNLKFKIENHQFDLGGRQWDGKKIIFNRSTKRVPTGLAEIYALLIREEEITQAEIANRQDDESAFPYPSEQTRKNQLAESIRKIAAARTGKPGFFSMNRRSLETQQIYTELTKIGLGGYEGCSMMSGSMPAAPAPTAP